MLHQTMRVAAAGRAAVGSKVTEMVQLVPEFRLAPQVLLWLNWFEFVPVGPMRVILSVPLLMLVTVTVCTGLVVPTISVPKAIVAGPSESGGGVPVPVRLTL